MPANSPTGQPVTGSAWFASGPGQALLDSETDVIGRALAGRSALPWLWLAPQLQPVPEGSGTGLCLVAGSGDWRGQVRCSVPLPFATGLFGTVLVQHAPGSPERLGALLHECARTLVNGGRLHLLALNPLSPYRLRWRGTGMCAREPLAWRRQLRAAGLVPEPVSQGVGPDWRVRVKEGVRNGPGLCAAYVLSAEKRVLPFTPVRRRLRFRLQHGLSAG